MADHDVNIILKAKDAASGPIGRVSHSLHSLGGHARGAGTQLAFLAKIGIIGVVSGLVGLAGALAYSTKQAAAEQVGIDRLDTSLKDNVKGWKGNTDAIEAWIAKQGEAGVADDQLRESLSTLLRTTHDVGQAQKLTTIAMDLARAKGISLAAATMLVSRTQLGSFGALKKLGIAFVPVTKAQEKLRATVKHATTEQKDHAKWLDRTASEELALASIQKSTAGAQEKYGKSAAGAQEAFGIALGNVVEDVGARFIPIMTEAFTFLRTDAIPAVYKIIDAVSTWVADNQPLIDQVAGFVRAELAVLADIIFNHIVPAIVTVAGRVRDWLNANKPLISQVQKFVTGVLSTLVTVLGHVVDWLAQVFGKITSNKDVMNGLGVAVGIVAAAFDLAWKAVAQLVDWFGQFIGWVTSNKTLMAGFQAVWALIEGNIKSIVEGLKWIIDNATAIANALGQGTSQGDVAARVRRQSGAPTGAPLTGGGSVHNHPVTVHNNVYLDGRKIAEAVDRRNHPKLQRAVATANRV
jgi:hypothetical protein